MSNGKNGYSEEFLQGITAEPADEDKRCVCCVVEYNDDVRDEDEVSEGIGECFYCGQQSCEWHGHNYSFGFAHEACHETPDFTRAEDGEY